MNSQLAASTIIENVTKWSKNHSRLIVGIDGIPGVGKTTVLDLMNGRIDALLVHMDDFLSSIDIRNDLIAKNASPEEFLSKLFDHEDIFELINLYKKGVQKTHTTLAYKSGKRQLEKTYDLTKPILLFEGTFMFDPNYFNHLWDKRIYLDGDERQIKERRVIRTKAMMGSNYIPEDDPRSFFYIGSKALEIYKKSVILKSKLTLLLLSHRIKIDSIYW